MRTVLIGSDFMYDQAGNLRPIEINTAVGYHNAKLESDDEVFDLSNLLNFINTNSFTKVVFIGGMSTLSLKLEDLFVNTPIEYEYVHVPNKSISVPYIEDNDDTLIIRSAYDGSSIVDDNYCRDKVQFLELIKSEPFGAQFAYINDENVLVNHITTINNNGNHPNFILKARLPKYNREVYPKLFKVSTQEELSIVLQNVTSDYFLMEFYFNTEKTYQNHITVIRELSILYPPSLNTLQIGSYNKFTSNNILTPSEFDSNTFELLDDRGKYITTDGQINQPKLQDTDLVQMGDGSFKTGLDLQIGDMVRTIDIPNPFNVNKVNEVVNYRIAFEELQSGTTYSTNMVTDKKRIDIFCDVVKILFTDGSDWLDTKESKYLSERNGEIRFLSLSNSGLDTNKINAGDKIILLDASTPEPTFIEREVANIEYIQEFFGGWVITVENESLFLTRSSEEDDTSFVAVEHNFAFCFTNAYFDCTDQGSCSSKYEICCNGMCQVL
jgi:hypothetical protein